MNSPLADRLRPRTLDEVCGQRHLLAPGCVFRRAVSGPRVPNMIFYGPPGVGKTTVARILAKNSGMLLRQLNGTAQARRTSKACWRTWAPLARTAACFCIWTRFNI